jgi:hypothetical protein
MQNGQGHVRSTGRASIRISECVGRRPSSLAFLGANLVELAGLDRGALGHAPAHDRSAARSGRVTDGSHRSPYP